MTDALLTVKIGGVAGMQPAVLDLLAERAGPGWVIVHGGGGEVSAWSQRLGLAPRMVDGLRVTDPQTLEVVVAVLRGLVNARLVARLEAAGVAAIGVSGADAGLLEIRPRDPSLGAVAEVASVDAGWLQTLVTGGLVPVVAPIAAAAGELYNVNADEVAAAIAGARGGRLLLLTDVPGVLRDGKLVTRLDAGDAEAMLADGSAAGGMRPKLRAAIDAAAAGCSVVIVDGRDARAVAAAIDGAAAGSEVVSGPAAARTRAAP